MNNDRPVLPGPSGEQGPARRDRRRGIAAVEFALTAPFLLALLMAIVVYGGWFWLAQSVQSLASEGARAALGGLDTAEQDRLARAFISDHAGQLNGLDVRRAVITITHDDQALRVQIAYDVRDHPLILLAGPLPKPPTTIARSAVVRRGGY